jgi:hypothetical protein
MGAAVAVEYHVAIVAVVVLVVVAHRHARDAGWFVAGMLPSAVFVLMYQWVAFGAPWHLPYQYYAGVLHGTTSGGYALPSLHGLVSVVVGVNGLGRLAPLVLVAIVAAVLVARVEGPARVHALVALAVVGAYVVLVAGWSGTDMLEDPGPRYLVPAIPFLAVPLAVAWSRVRTPARLAAMWGALVMTMATVTLHLVAEGHDRFAAYLHYVQEREFDQTVWSIALGRPGVVLYLTSVAAACAGAIHVARRHANECSADLAPAGTLSSRGRDHHHPGRA